MPQPQPPASKPKGLKILMLHGYTQSGSVFHAKTRALEKNLQKAFPGTQLVYPTAPIRLTRADIPTWDGVQPSSNIDDASDPDAFAWWCKKGTAEPYAYEGLDEGLAETARVLREDGPFDGVIGFSQGGALAGMVASLLEPGRQDAFSQHAKENANNTGAATAYPYPRSFLVSGEAVHPPMKFAVSYSGFGSANLAAYGAFYEPRIHTPTMHFLGSLDTVVEEKRSLLLVEACEAPKVVYHPGGHFLPASQREFVGALVAFIRDVMAGSGNKSMKAEDKAEDMELPF